MKINIAHVANLANLTLSKDEEKKFSTQLSAILDYIVKLNEIDTKNIEPTSQVTGLENILREDVAEESLPTATVLGQTKSTRNNFFQVKGILEE